MEPTHWLFLVLVLVLLIFVALIGYGVHRISKSEWFNRHVIGPVPPENEDIFDSEQRPKVHFHDSQFFRGHRH